MTPEQLKELDEFISPLIKKGQPLSHIFSIYGDSMPCSRKTIYNYQEGVLVSGGGGSARGEGKIGGITYTAAFYALK